MHRLIGPAFALVVVSVLSWVVVGCASTDGSVTDRSQGLASQWLQTVTGSQRDILTDLEVTTPEYDQALNTARACIEAQGFGTSNIRLVGDKVRHDFIVRPEGKSTDAALKALFDCRHDAIDAVESVYLAQHSRASEGLNVLESELIDCLADEGVREVPRGLTDFELFKLLRDRVVSTAAWFCRDTFLIAIGKLGATPPD